MLAKIDAPFLDRGDDGREVVVGQDHVGGILRHVGAGDAHRHADVGRLQRRGVVHAVAGHRHDLAVARSAPGRSAACARARRARRPTTSRTASRSCASSICCELRSRRASVAPSSAMPSSAAIAAAVTGWSPVIMIGRMPARLASRHRGAGLGPRRVDHPDDAEPHERLLHLLAELAGERVACRACGRRRRGSAAPPRPAGRRRAGSPRGAPAVSGPGARHRPAPRCSAPAGRRARPSRGRSTRSSLALSV